MKSTIKLDASKAITIEPDGVAVRFSVTVGAIPVYRTQLTPDQCGAILFAIEQAAEAVQLATARSTA